MEAANEFLMNLNDLYFRDYHLRLRYYLYTFTYNILYYIMSYVYSNKYESAKCSYRRETQLIIHI